MFSLFHLQQLELNTKTPVWLRTYEICPYDLHLTLSNPAQYIKEFKCNLLTPE